jgi:transposase
VLGPHVHDLIHFALIQELDDSASFSWYLLFFQGSNRGQMFRIRLSGKEQAAVAQKYKTTTDRRLRDRCQAVLMAHRGRKRQAIAEDLGVHRTTVKKWLDQYRAGGVAGLKVGRAPGKPQRIPPALASTIIDWVKGGPQGCGLNRANWTYEELAMQVSRTTGLVIKRTAMRDFCQRHEIRPYRPTYRYLRGDPQRQAVAKAELVETKKKLKPGSASC